jgi:arylsulfatase A-like enzyme
MRFRFPCTSTATRRTPFAACTALLLLLLAAPVAPRGAHAQGAPARPPNVVILFADDLGYGDLGVYGHPTIHTPHLDRMAREGMKFTQFYVGASVCTPSRAALMTGRYPMRSGMMSDDSWVLFPNSTGGIPQSEILIPEALSERGYATGMVGKWHLGHLEQYLPTKNGFDSYFGLPYSNNMRPLRFFQNGEVLEDSVDQTALRERYTREAVRFIDQNQNEPFFLYLSYNAPHFYLHPSERFAGTSARGKYGDIVEELDWSIGEVLQALRERGLGENTLVFFVSDNGPALPFDLGGGSAGLLRGGKGTTWEGGMRVPAIAWGPGTIEAGTTTDALATAMDLYPTVLEMAGAQAPSDRVIDGVNLLPVLRDPEAEGRDVVFYHKAEQVQAVRRGPWKMHLTASQNPDRGRPAEEAPPLLYHLGRDPSERYNVAGEHPEVIEALKTLVDEHRSGLAPPETNQLETRVDSVVGFN